MFGTCKKKKKKKKGQSRGPEPKEKKEKKKKIAIYLSSLHEVLRVESRQKNITNF